MSHYEKSSGPVLTKMEHCAPAAKCQNASPKRNITSQATGSFCPIKRSELKTEVTTPIGVPLREQKFEATTNICKKISDDVNCDLLNIASTEQSVDKCAENRLGSLSYSPKKILAPEVKSQVSGCNEIHSNTPLKSFHDSSTQILASSTSKDTTQLVVQFPPRNLQNRPLSSKSYVRRHSLGTESLHYSTSKFVGGMESWLAKESRSQTGDEDKSSHDLSYSGVRSAYTQRIASQLPPSSDIGDKTSSNSNMENFSNASLYSKEKRMSDTCGYGGRHKDKSYRRKSNLNRSALVEELHSPSLKSSEGSTWRPSHSRSKSDFDSFTSDYERKEVYHNAFSGSPVHLPGRRKSRDHMFSSRDSLHDTQKSEYNCAANMDLNLQSRRDQETVSCNSESPRKASLALCRPEIPKVLQRHSSTDKENTDKCEASLSAKQTESLNVKNNNTSSETELQNCYVSQKFLKYSQQNDIEKVPSGINIISLDSVSQNKRDSIRVEESSEIGAETIRETVWCEKSSESLVKDSDQYTNTSSAYLNIQNKSISDAEAIGENNVDCSVVDSEADDAYFTPPATFKKIKVPTVARSDSTDILQRDKLSDSAGDVPSSTEASVASNAIDLFEDESHFSSVSHIANCPLDANFNTVVEYYIKENSTCEANTSGDNETQNACDQCSKYPIMQEGDDTWMICEGMKNVKVESEAMPGDLELPYMITGDEDNNEYSQEADDAPKYQSDKPSKQPASILKKSTAGLKGGFHGILKPYGEEEKFARHPSSILKYRGSSEERECSGRQSELHSILKKSTSEDERSSSPEIRPILKNTSTDDESSSKARPRPILKKKTSFSEDVAVKSSENELKPILKKKTITDGIEEQPKPILKTRRKSEETGEILDQLALGGRPRAYSADHGIKSILKNRSAQDETASPFDDHRPYESQ